MRCEEWCESLSALIDRELDAPALRALAAHLKGCVDCCRECACLACAEAAASPRCSEAPAVLWERVEGALAAGGIGTTAGPEAAAERSHVLEELPQDATMANIQEPGAVMPDPGGVTSASGTPDRQQPEPPAANPGRTADVRTPEVLTAAEAAAFLRLSPEDLLASLDELPHFRIGEQVRFRRLSLERWMAAQERLRSPAAGAPALRTGTDGGATEGRVVDFAQACARLSRRGRA